ncbi:D-alanyl-D-alanine carboxypeptidase/D-alanyl-D-alanine-endopeptidase [Actinoplanes sp. NPDC049265]|uniref:D-alanyl-D-alanine carboxypeptidase/D-alanyl-D-alanine endopeptidase n=1 Tax=Actinoplanes sp. NPDC049265 TaxID=3363902 RepID=UPI0037226018
MVSGLLTLILIVAVGAAAFIMRPGPIAGWLADKTDPTASPSVAPEPTPTPVLAAAGESATQPSAAAVQQAIGGLLGAKALGSRVRASVVDVSTGATLYAQNAATPTTPASTTKLVTAATVLATRGPAYRLTTRVVAGGQPGEVVLVGGGDPTLAVNSKGQFPGAARLDKLADQVKTAMDGTPITRVLIDTSLFSGSTTAKGWNRTIIAPEGQVAAVMPLMTNAGRRQPVHHEVGGDPRFTDPALAAGQAFARQLGVKAAVTRGSAPAAATAAAGGAIVPGAELGKVQSPPLVHVIDWMLEQSDNTIAEVLSRQVALAAGAPATFDGATTSMIAKLTELGLPAGEIKLSDASGLSRLNQISPDLLTKLLALAAQGDHPELTSMFGGLPVAGWSGTLRTRFVTPAPNRAGQGLVRAKTGSLSGVNTIAGQLVTKDGRLLVFAIMADATGDSVTARQALDRVATRLVACGC